MSGERILVVDDEPEIRKALEKTLRGAGYDVDTAASGEDAGKDSTKDPGKDSAEDDPDDPDGLPAAR